MLGELKDKLTCRADEGYRRLEVEVRKDDAKPKAPKLSGGSLRVMGGAKQRWEKTKIKTHSLQAIKEKDTLSKKEIKTHSPQAVTIEKIHCK